MDPVGSRDVTSPNSHAQGGLSLERFNHSSQSRARERSVGSVSRARSVTVPNAPLPSHRVRSTRSQLSRRAAKAGQG